MILLHDTLNGRVRTGLEMVEYGDFDKVRSSIWILYPVE